MSNESFARETQRYLALKRQGKAGIYEQEQKLVKQIGFQTMTGFTAIAIGSVVIGRYRGWGLGRTILLSSLMTTSWVMVYPASRTITHFRKFAACDRSVYADSFCPDVLAHAQSLTSTQTPPYPYDWIATCRNYLERRKPIESDEPVQPGNPPPQPSLTPKKEPASLAGGSFGHEPSFNSDLGASSDSWSIGPLAHDPLPQTPPILHPSFQEPSFSSSQEPSFSDDSSASTPQTEKPKQLSPDEMQAARFRQRHQERS